MRHKTTAFSLSSEKFLGSIIGKYVVQTQRMFEFMRLSKNGGNESREFCPIDN